MQIDPADLRFANLVIAAQVSKLHLRGVIRLNEKLDVASDVMARLLAVWEAYDPQRGPREAYINQVVNTQLVSIQRAKAALKRAGKTCPLGDLADGVADPTLARGGRQRVINLRIDIAAVIGKLTPHQQKLARLLKHKRVAPVAKQLGIPRRTLRDQIACMREVFRAAGLEEYL